VPLTPLALSLLGETIGDLVFGGRDWGKRKRTLTAKAGLARPWVLHDIRRSVATGMADLGVLPHIIEAVLNHVSGHRAGVAGIYNRARYEAEMRDALTKWAEPEKFAELKESIRKYGLEQKLIIYNGNQDGTKGTWRLLDGRNRRQALKELGVEITVTMVETFEGTWTDAKAKVYALNYAPSADFNEAWL
jgi:ParB-like nuclease domain